jgi:hypothetical protein
VPPKGGKSCQHASAIAALHIKHNAPFCYFWPSRPRGGLTSQKPRKHPRLTKQGVMLNVSLRGGVQPSSHVLRSLRALHARVFQAARLALELFLQSGGCRRRVFLITNALTRGYVPPPTLGGWRFAPNPARVQPVHPPRGFPLPRAGSAALPFAASCNLSRSTAQPAFLPRLWRVIQVPRTHPHPFFTAMLHHACLSIKAKRLRR